MNKLILLLVTFLLTQPLYAQDFTQTSDAPYIYYYSDALNGLVIERADGTDSRVIGTGLAGERLYRIDGPGWSSDGTWFAWHKWSRNRIWSTVDSVYAIHVSGERNLVNQLQDYGCVLWLEWSPNTNMLIVLGKLTLRTSCNSTSQLVQTYRLIDAELLTIAAEFSIASSGDFQSPIYPHIVWNDVGSGVQVLEGMDRYSASNDYSIQSVQISMNVGGSVFMEPATDDSLVVLTTAERWRNFNPSSGPGNPRNMFTVLWEDSEAREIAVPPAIDYSGGPVGVFWHSSREWLFIGHEYCRADCAGAVGAVSIVNRIDGSVREISNCGGVIACVGWLPETVNIDMLPSGRSQSVLPAPFSIHYVDLSQNGNPYGGSLLNEYPYRLECGMGLYERSLVVDATTNILIFTLPDPEPCGTDRDPEDIVFALSPDSTYYALTDRTRLTSLYRAADGQRIARLNFFGEQLEFSADSQFLTTTSASATAVWNIETLVRDSLTLVE